MGHIGVGWGGSCRGGVGHEEVEWGGSSFCRLFYCMSHPTSPLHGPPHPCMTHPPLSKIHEWIQWDVYEEGESFSSCDKCQIKLLNEFVCNSHSTFYK